MFPRSKWLNVIFSTGACVAGCTVSSQCEPPEHAVISPDDRAPRGGDESCANDPHSTPELRVYRNPYANVDWLRDRRLIAQFHDHAQTRTDYIDLYDAAGYDVISLFHYIGVPQVEAAWKEVHWPPEAWLPNGYTESLSSIEQFYPGGEHAASWHLTGPFLSEYIELWDASKDPVKLDHHYETDQELIDLITAGGGYPVLAHPWAPVSHFSNLTGLHAIEIYSAFGEINYLSGVADVQPNDLMEAVWDDALERDPNIYGIAVNDWRGPFCKTEDCLAHPRATDSGKVELIAHRASLPDIEAAFASGAMFAVKDYGLTKLRYPRVESIEVDSSSIVITARGEVRWISHGEQVGVGEQLELDTLPLNSRYVRAEISDADGSIVFVQPFVLAYVGDVDGDGDVDSRDSELCEQVVAGLDTLPDHVAAVAAVDDCG